MRAARGLPVALIFLAVAVAALNLRAGIASVGSVLDDVLTSFGASGSYAGMVTALPGVCFAIMGLAAVPIARRLGLARTLLSGMVLTLVGVAVRPWVNDAWVFLGLSALVVAGIALANVLLPAWIKLHGGRHIVTLMTLNTAFLGVSSAIGPLSAVLYEGPDGWRRALFFWASIAVAQVVVWVVVALRTGYDFPASQRAAGESRGPSLLKAPTAIFLMLFFGMQSMNAYVQMGYLPQIVVDGGGSANLGSMAIAMVGALNILGGIVMPKLVDKLQTMTPTVIILSAFAVIGYLGLMFAPTSLALLWGVILGLGGWAFPTALALIVARSRAPEVTARLSGFVQPVGYVLAAAGPMIIGLVYTPDSPNWTPILIGLIAASVLQGIIGARASRRGFIDDELAARSA